MLRWSRDPCEALGYTVMIKCCRNRKMACIGCGLQSASAHLYHLSNWPFAQGTSSALVIQRFSTPLAHLCFWTTPTWGFRHGDPWWNSIADRRYDCMVTRKTRHMEPSQSLQTAVLRNIPKTRNTSLGWELAVCVKRVEDIPFLTSSGFLGAGMMVG